MPKKRSIRRKLLKWLVLSIALAAGTALIVEHLQRQDEIARLASQVIRGEPDEATAAVHKLAAFTTPPFDILVSAAASPVRPVALAAQEAITERLQLTQRQLHLRIDDGKAARHLQNLAGELDSHRQSFAVADFLWLSRTAETIVRQIGSGPAKNASGVAYHCDVVLAMIETRTRGTPRKPNIAPPQPKPSVAATAKPALSRQTPSAAPREPVASTTDEIEFAKEDADANLYVAPPRSAWRAVLRNESPRNEIAPESNAPATTSSQSPNSDSIQPEWAPRTLPLSEADPRPIESPRRERQWTTSSPSASNAEPPSAPLKIVESRLLLERWQSQPVADRFPIENELTRRGFTPLVDKLVTPILSDDPEVRAAVVQTILDNPGINAPAWLILLAEDRDPTVRLAAVNVMATSRDPEMLEKAWQVALHDRDPRIADLATRLAERRSGTKRR